MKEPKAELIKQFERARRLNWLPFFVEAVKTHTSDHFDAADLLAVGSRETNLDPKWLTKAGDRGNGFGLLQADARSFPEWIKTGKWRDAREGILMGARVLMQKWTDTQNCINKRATVRSSKSGTIFTFIGKRVAGAEAQTVAIAAYNSGRWAHFAVSKGQAADKYTTGGDYSTDVQQRAAFFRPLMEKWMIENALVDPVVTPTAPTAPDTGAAAAAPVVLTPTEPAKDDSFLNAALDRNVSADAVKAGLPSLSARIWKYIARPLGLLYVALEAGNVAAWLGVVAVAAIVVYLIYAHRKDFLKLWETLKNKITS